MQGSLSHQRSDHYTHGRDCPQAPRVACVWRTVPLPSKLRSPSVSPLTADLARLPVRRASSVLAQCGGAAAGPELEREGEVVGDLAERETTVSTLAVISLGAVPTGARLASPPARSTPRPGLRASPSR